MSLLVTIPRAVQLVLDDVGWREGWRLDADGGPYRAGLDRVLGPADYAAIADLGERLVIRPSAATILCEWDRENVCAQHPTSTQAGAAWDNSSRAGEWSDEAAEVFRRRSAHLELALHGVGHEHWDDGVRTRAEWYGADGQKWEWEALRGHLDAYQAILDQHGLGPSGGHRFPLHMVPCAFRYLWDETDATDTGALMATAGVELVSTPFSPGCLQRNSPLLAVDGGLDHGRLVLDRGRNGVPWDALDTVPDEVMGKAAGDDQDVLAEYAAGALALSVEEVEVRLARRVLGRADDREELVAAHRPLVADVARLHTDCGLSAGELLMAGDRGLREAVQAFDDRQDKVAFDVFAEHLVREAMGQAVAAGGGRPAAVAAQRSSSICGIHWPNLLRLDPAENELSVGRWAEYLRQVGEQPGLMLAANVRECFAQWAYHTFGRVEPTEHGFVLDLTGVPEALVPLLGGLPVVVEVGAYARLGAIESGALRAVWYRRSGARAFVALAAPGRVRAEVGFRDDRPLQPVAFRDGTFNVLDLNSVPEGLELVLEMFGRQQVPVAPGFPPRAVEVIEGGLKVEGLALNPALGLATLTVSCHDIQGQRGRLRLVS